MQEEVELEVNVIGGKKAAKKKIPGERRKATTERLPHPAQA